MGRAVDHTIRVVAAIRRAGRTGKRRTRLSAEDARAAILAAAEKRLLEVGPSGLRLQEIAKDVGLSHPTVLHHFGNRDALVKAVVTRANDSLQRDLLACFVDLEGDPERIAETALARIDQAMRKNGHARVLAWLALAQVELPGETPLRQLVDVIERARVTAGAPGSTEQAQFAVLLTSAAMFGIALVGGALCRQLGLTDPDAVLDRFRSWFGHVLVSALTARTGSPQTST